MRSRRWIGRAAGLAAAIGILAATTGTAAATPVFAPAGTGFTLANTTEHVFSISSSIKWRCNQVRWAGTTANPESDTVSITATYGTATGVSGAWCRLYVGGSFSGSTLTPSASWTLKVLAYNPLTGVSTGSLTTSGGSAITWGSCTITISSGAVLALEGQNDAWGPDGPGLSLDAAGTGLSYTSSGCGAWGIPASGSTMTYSGSSYSPDIYAAP